MHEFLASWGGGGGNMNTRGGNMNTRGGNMNTRGGANANVPPAPPERNPIIYRFLNTISYSNNIYRLLNTISYST